MTTWNYDDGEANPRAVGEDELLTEFHNIPTVTATLADTDPAEVRRAMVTLADQAVTAQAGKEELADALRALDPNSWGTAKNKNRVY